LDHKPFSELKRPGYFMPRRLRLMFTLTVATPKWLNPKPKKLVTQKKVGHEPGLTLPA